MGTVPKGDRKALLSELRERKKCVDDACDCDPQGGHVASATSLLFQYIGDREIEAAFWDAARDCI